MEVELLEIRQFLEQRNPFSYLSPELLDELPKGPSGKVQRLKLLEI